MADTPNIFGSSAFTGDAGSSIAGIAQGFARGLQRQQLEEHVNELQSREALAKKFDSIEGDTTYDQDARDKARDYAMQLRLLHPQDTTPPEFKPDKALMKHGATGIGAVPAWFKVTHKKTLKDGPSQPAEPAAPADPTAMDKGPPDFASLIAMGHSGLPGAGNMDASAGPAPAAGPTTGPPPNFDALMAAAHAAPNGGPAPSPISSPNGPAPPPSIDDFLSHYTSTRRTPQDVAHEKKSVTDIESSVPDDVADSLGIPRGTPTKMVSEYRLKQQAASTQALNEAKAEHEKAAALMEQAQIETEPVKRQSMMLTAKAHMRAADAAMVKAQTPSPISLILGGGGVAAAGGAAGAGGPAAEDWHIKQTVGGHDYVDLSDYTGNTKAALMERYGKQGIATLDNKDAIGTISDIDSARLNLSSIGQDIFSSLPADAEDRPLSALSNKFAQIFQTNDGIGAYNSWRTSAIKALKAAAGRAGLRINQQEILLATANDIPQITDTVGVAKRKIANMNAQFDNVESSLLIPRRGGMKGSTGKGDNAAPPPPPNVDLPPKSARVPGKTTATINGQPMIWMVDAQSPEGGWEPVK